MTAQNLWDHQGPIKNLGPTRHVQPEAQDSKIPLIKKPNTQNPNPFPKLKHETTHKPINELRTLRLNFRKPQNEALNE